MGKLYTQLNIEERTMIQTQLGMGLKPAVMSRGPHRSASMIARELCRNGWVHPLGRHRPGRPPAVGGYRAETARKGASHVLHWIEAQKRLPLTDDPGRERAEHQRLTQATGVKICFADPHSPRQCGLNEHTNGLLRQVPPQGGDQCGIPQEALDAIAWRRNTRPQKSPGFKCPAERFTPDAFNRRPHHAALFCTGSLKPPPELPV